MFEFFKSFAEGARCRGVNRIAEMRPVDSDRENFAVFVKENRLIRHGGSDLPRWLKPDLPASLIASINACSTPLWRQQTRSTQVRSATTLLCASSAATAPIRSIAVLTFWRSEEHTSEL